MRDTRIFYFAPFRLDLGAERLWCEEEPVRLTAKAFAVLRYLVDHAGYMVTKNELFEAAWALPAVSEATLTVCVGEIRRALGDTAQTPQFVETVRGRGYRFLAPVTLAPLSATPRQRRDSSFMTPVTAGDSPARAYPGEALWHAAPVPLSQEAVLPSPDILAPQEGAKRNSLDSRANTMPALLTPLIGREQECAAAGQLLQRAEVRLLTLTGPGGSGKTRLGLQVASDLCKYFASGVCFVPLATITDPALVPSAIAQTLGIQEKAGQAPLEVLKDTLRNTQMLMVLDNFEQVMGAALAIAELLLACPRLKVLVTSREVLHLSGEHEFSVLPLAVPDLRNLPRAATLSQYAAVALFIQRALAIKPDFTVTNDNAPAVAEICVRLDGLPLAIELAAARLKLFSPQALLARLDSRLDVLHGGARDVPSRHQTLRRAMAWSYELLDVSEQVLFRRLAVFVGGCPLEAAAVVYHAVDNPPASVGGSIEMEVVDRVMSLVDKSLLQPEEQGPGAPRFRMLETIRAYGLEHLMASGEEQVVRHVHADYYLALAETAEPALAGADQAAWLERLETEHDNLRAALRWLEESGEAERSLRLAGALCQFWLARGYLHEGRERLAQILRLPETSQHTAARAKALAGGGNLAHNQGDYTAARVLFEESLALWREMGHKQGVATALNDLGWVAWRQGDYAVTRALSEESLTLWQEIGDWQGIATSLTNLGWTAHHQGDYATAGALHQESLTLRRALEDQRGVAFSLTLLGWTVSGQGDYERASVVLEEALVLFQDVGMKQLFAFTSSIMAEVIHAQGDDGRATALLAKSIQLFRAIGDKYGLALALSALGAVVYTQGDVRHATILYEESLVLGTAIGDKWGRARVLSQLGIVAHAQGDDRRATALYEESLVLRRAIGDKHGIAECLEGLAEIAGARRQLEQAARLLGAAEALRATTGAPLSPRERVRYDRLISAVRAELDEAVLVAAWVVGTTTLE